MFTVRESLLCMIGVLKINILNEGSKTMHGDHSPKTMANSQGCMSSGLLRRQLFWQPNNIITLNFSPEIRNKNGFLTRNSKNMRMQVPFLRWLGIYKEKGAGG